MDEEQTRYQQDLRKDFTTQADTGTNDCVEGAAEVQWK
jgi:hypothetical protein